MKTLKYLKFYVYVYLDIRKPGKYIYDEFQFDYEPFYVGKGQGQRLFSHLRLANKYIQHKKMRRIRNMFLLHKIIKILNTNKNPLIIKVKENISEKEAFDLEQNMINQIGRKINKGPLTNMTEGGDGPAPTKKTKDRIRRSLKKYYKNNPVTLETRQLLSKVHKGKPLSEKTKQNMSNCKIGKQLSEQHKANMRRARLKMVKNGWQPWNKGVPCLEETKRAISLATKGWHHTEEAKAKISKNHSNKGKHLSEETKQKIASKTSESIKKWWAIKKGLLNENHGN